MEMHFNELEDNRLFIGTDLNGTLYYIEMPDIFLLYKKNISDSINSVFYNHFSDVVHPSFIKKIVEHPILNRR